METPDTVTPRSLETIYKGYRFRSRLEARWAVFLDAAGIAWTYEPEGFDLGEAGWYLPDFWLPDGAVDGLWVEIKPCVPDGAECEKMRALTLGAQNHGLILGGNVGWDEFRGWVFDEGSHGSEEGCDYTLAVILPGQLVLPNRPTCVACGAERYCGESDRCEAHLPDVLWTRTPRVDDAFTAARSARFEHGELPVF